MGVVFETLNKNSEEVMHSFKEKIINDVRSYINMKHSEKSWVAGEDWVPYSGPYFNENEYVAAIESLLSEWLIFGKKGAEFENEFAILATKREKQ